MVFGPADLVLITYISNNATAMQQKIAKENATKAEQQGAFYKKSLELEKAIEQLGSRAKPKLDSYIEILLINTKQHKIEIIFIKGFSL